jgi:hypothetical protein
MENKITTAQILETISLNKSEYNIKTLNTIDTIDTKNYEISSVFAHGVKQLPSSTSSLIGLVPEELKEVVVPTEQTVGLNVSAAPEITYLSASLKASKTIRRTLNVDFRLSTTPPGTFNKLVFSLAHSSRQREFFSNIPEQYRNEWEYEETYAKFSMILGKDKWLGKGRPRDKFIKGQVRRSTLELGSACVLEIKQGQNIVHLYIEGMYKELILSPVDNQQYPFRYDSGSTLQTPQILPRRSSWK